MNPPWQQRAAWCEQPDHVGFAALAGGRWVGTMRALIDEATGHPTLVGVFVDPEYRGPGAGVTDALLDAVETWASRRGHHELVLEVHEHNERAQRFYLRRGYQFTGERAPYPVNPAEWELAMRRDLPDHSGVKPAASAAIPPDSGPDARLDA